MPRPQHLPRRRVHRRPHLTIGTRLTVRFGGPQLPTIEAPCIARWHDANGSGLQFEGLRAVDTYTLSKFLRAASRPTGRIPTDAILRPV